MGALNSDLMAPPTTSSNPAEERKLWADYIRSLNERRLQAAQRSGWTNHVLLGVLAGLLYQFVPRLPQFLANPGSVTTALVTAVLMTDALAYFVLGYFLLVYYCIGGIEHRVLPESRRRATNILLGAVLSAGAGFSILQIWISLTFPFSSSFVKWSMLSLGVWWAINLAQGCVKQIRAVHRAQLHKIPLPRFTASVFSPNWESLAALGIIVAIAVLASIALTIYLSAIPINWVAPLGAASVFLTCVSIVSVVFSRGLSVSSQVTYEVLERDILLDQLDPIDIRKRFLRTALGSDTAAWLDDLLQDVRSECETLARVRDSGQTVLEGIMAIDPKYSAERTARAGKALDELKASRERYIARLKAMQFQMQMFLQVHKTDREHEALNRWTNDFKNITAHSAETMKSLSTLKNDLDELMFKH